MRTTTRTSTTAMILSLATALVILSGCQKTPAPDSLSEAEWLDTLRTNDNKELNAAAKTMARVGQPLAAVMSRGLDDADWRVRWGSCLAIKDLASRDEPPSTWGHPPVAKLAHLLENDESRKTRVMSARALAALGAAAEEALPALTRVRNNEYDQRILLPVDAAIRRIKG